MPRGLAYAGCDHRRLQATMRKQSVTFSGWLHRNSHWRRENHPPKLVKWKGFMNFSSFNKCNLCVWVGLETREDEGEEGGERERDITSYFISLNTQSAL